MHSGDIPGCGEATESFACDCDTFFLILNCYYGYISVKNLNLHVQVHTDDL